MRAHPLSFTLAFSLVACGGADFDVGAETGTDAAEETAGDVGIDTSDSVPADSATLDSAIGDTGPEADSGCKPLNECGGCSSLEFPPGTSCGLCGSAKYMCDGKEKTRCNDPITTAPGTACGTCKTLKLVCAGDGLSTKCPGDDANACGGCKTLSPAPETVCGVCTSGRYKCNGTEATKCSDPVPSTATALGTACGICATSKFVCNSTNTNTECAKADDRTSGADTYNTARTTSWDLSYGVSQRIALTLKHKGAIHTLTVSVGKSPAAGSSSGGMDVALYVGKPDDTTPTLVTSTTVLPASIPNGLGGAPVDIVLPSPTTVYAAGTQLFVELKGANPAYNFQTEGGNSAVAGEVFYLLSSGKWSSYSGYSPYLKVQMTGCF